MTDLENGARGICPAALIMRLKRFRGKQINVADNIVDMLAIENAWSAVSTAIYDVMHETKTGRPYLK